MLNYINNILWIFASFLLLFSAFYFTLHLKFIPFHFRKMAKSLFQKVENGIKPYQTLMMVLAGRIGVGSIAGVALAIYLGGIGSIFWMWILSFLSAANCFAETCLGILYKEKDEGYIYKGGPSYYLKNGLAYRKLGAIYAILVMISYLCGFLGIQANTITKSAMEFINISPFFIGFLIIIITSFIIFGGLHTIANTTSKLVPFMTIGYIGIGFYICMQNIEMLPSLFTNIMKEAFSFKPFFSSFLPMFIIGMQRGIFSNEAGLGTGAIASSTVNTDDACMQGYLQMIGVYITTLLICTSTAIIILTSPYHQLHLQDVNGIEITQFAFRYHLGEAGNLFIFLSIVLFSFSTILTGYYDGESSLKYFYQKVKSSYLFFLKLATLVILLLGSILSSSFLWSLIDILVAFLALINVYALLKLRKDIINEYKNFRIKMRKKTKV